MSVLLPGDVVVMNDLNGAIITRLNRRHAWIAIINPQTGDMGWSHITRVPKGNIVHLDYNLLDWEEYSRFNTGVNHHDWQLWCNTLPIKR